MIEVDIFWSFVFGAYFAVGGWSEVKYNVDFRNTKAYVYTLEFLGLIFAPSGIYLLWAFPGWESMYYFKEGKDGIQPWLPLVFAVTNVSNGIIGFWVASQLVRRNALLSAHSVWIVALSIFAAILGFGYARFLYPSDHVDWAAGKTYPLLDFFRGSPVFVTLLCMGILLLPAMWYPIISWRKTQSNPCVPEPVVEHTVSLVSRLLFAYAGGYAIFILGYCDDQSREYFVHPGSYSGYWAPLVGCVVAHLPVFVLALVPYFYLRRFDSARNARSHAKVEARPDTPRRSRSPAPKGRGKVMMEVVGVQAGRYLLD